MESNRGGVDDMVELPAISEKDIAENLRVRLKNETIYVSNTNDYCSFPCLTTVQKAISVSVNEKKKPSHLNTAYIVVVVACRLVGK